MSLAAGIIPYSVSNKEVSFLLGFEKYNSKWSGFVGGHEASDQTIVNTAIREFNEETTTIFQEYLPYIRESISTGKAILVKDLSPTNRTVYLYFVNFPKITNLHLKYIPRKEYQEKSSLRWFTLSEIKKSNTVFVPLKNSILRTF